MSGQADSKEQFDCEQVEALLVAYYKGSLSSQPRRAVSRHLSGCDTCAFALREFNMLEAELRAEADRYQPRLSPDASQRIQEQVYRRMRLSLVWQRMFQVVKAGFAVASFIIIVGIFGIFAYQWLQFVANPTPVPGATFTEETAVPIQQDSPSVPEVVETAVPAPEIAPTTVPPEMPSVLPTLPSIAGDRPLAPLASNVPRYWQNLTSPMPGSAPQQITQAIVDAALAAETGVLSEHLVALGSSKQEPAIRLWRLFSRRCSNVITAEDFSYRQLPTGESSMTAVYIYHNDRYTGEIKFRFIDDNWYPVFSNPPYLNTCLKTRLVFPDQ
ncbi:MAG: zf-HC2 domain-containing protein [Anaerolineales bacterium]|nr:zf-HC2 domain-containing protein [Anaerolineales bacterium]MCA9929844.1 zf-HC2 domain-containing protein [Anaerolineales bacterium]